MTKRRIATLLACAAVSGLIASVGQMAWSQGQSVITTVTGGYYLTVDPGPSSAYTPKISLTNFWASPSQVTQQAGTGTATFLPMGKIYGTTGTNVVIANGTVQGLGTLSLPATAFSTAGKKVHITAIFNHGSAPSTTLYRLSFGGTNALIQTTDTIISNNDWLEMWVTSTGTAFYQIANARGQSGTTNLTPIGTAGFLGGATPTDYTISAGCGGTSSNCALNDMIVEFLN